eukprot:EG_transcript_32582
MDFDGLANIQFALQSALLGMGASSLMNPEAVKSNPLFDAPQLKPSSFQPILPGPWGCSPLSGSTKLNPAASQFEWANAIYTQYALQMQLQQLALSSAATTPFGTLDATAPQPRVPSPSTEAPAVSAMADLKASRDTPSPPRAFLPSCCVCDEHEHFGSQSDAEAHFLSKDHQRRVFEQEQCAVIVTG